MFRWLTYAGLERSINRAYTQQLLNSGASPKGVFWQNQSTQFARFDALLSLVIKVTPVLCPSLADIGCGYGAMFNFITKNERFKNFNYCGFDINRAMIRACQQQFPNQKHLFSLTKTPPENVDFCIFSGTFNLCHTSNTDLWNDYIFINLQQCWKRSRYGLALNLLCEPKSHIRKQIFYANRQDFISRANEVFGPTYARSTPHVAGDVTFMINKPGANR